jgi:predicted Zn-dependent protease
MRGGSPLKVLGLSLLLASCGAGEPIGGRPTISEEDRVFGAQQHPQLLAEFGGSYAGDEADYVRVVGERIAAAAGVGGECTFTLVNSDVVNAFAVPGCFIYVTRGLLSVVTSEAELASVLGHEVGHIAARHAQRQEKRSLWRKLGVLAASLTGSERLTQLAGQAAQYFGLRYSRKQEYEADDLGINYLRQAKYDVFAAAEMLADLQRQEQFMRSTGSRDPARSVPEWALSHPLTEHRIGRARDTARKTGLADDALSENAEAYLTALDGLLYGDDPEQGFVIGRRFSHPIMGIEFVAPEGFTLTNSPQAVRISGPNGVSGEFGGGAVPSGGLKAYAEALAGELLGETPAQVVSAVETHVNGMRALVVQMRVAVRDGTVPISVAAYEGARGHAYHFILISPPADPSANEVSELIQSFRRLSSNEAAALRPRFIRAVRVSASDTREKLIGRMADPAPRELFELLNGRVSQSLRPGDFIKIVTF